MVTKVFRLVTLVLSAQISFFSCSSSENLKYFEVSKGANNTYTLKMKEMGDEPINGYSFKSYNTLDRIEMIAELLRFENDTRICKSNVKNYNAASSTLYIGPKNYSLQVEALFIINQIYFDKPFDYSPIPAVVDKTSKKTETIKGDIISKTFDIYKKWFANVKKDSNLLHNSLGNNPTLDSLMLEANLKWYGSLGDEW